MSAAETTSTKRQSRGARGKILAAAARRFYLDGVAATGIDTITAEAGVAKMSLYNNFASKADLVAAYIDARHQEWLALYRARELEAVTPRERIVAVFDAYVDHAAAAYDHAFRGCGLLNAAAELPAGDPGRDSVRRHKEEVESILREQLLQLTSAETADLMAEHLSFVLEGSMARAGLEGNDQRLLSARALALGLVGTL
ncbi:TetR/AcrR family transcriptional regulator [Leifsonia poae]|uniref:TetR/AcrR family transcriptional regulator n=1 Tax=Leifsonia poae TaxID=110933 RepID=UPI001CC0D94A|nr:TetR/AcrR family transcriptional regulator [Leifsonia poae]